MSIMTKKGERPPVKGNRNAGCPCTRSRGALIVQCRECSGSQDLTDPACLRKVLISMATESSAVGEIVLSSHWEIRYDGACADALTGLAEALRFLRGVGGEGRFEECPSCPSNPSSVAERASASIPSASPELVEGFKVSPGPHGRACEQCAQTTEANLRHARTLLSAAHSAVNRAAFRVVSSDAW